ncbi:biopolymer transporter ExbD [Spirosoma gilvum]
MLTRRISTTLQVDFKPIVSVALLVIVFFVWVKAAKEPEVMGVAIPKECRKLEIQHTPKKVVTLYLLAKSQIGIMQYWKGDDMVELSQISPETDNISKLLEGLKKATDGDMAVMVKPTQLATFRNVSDVLDVLREVDIPYVPITTLTGFEQRRMKYYEQKFTHHRIGSGTLFLKMEPFYCSIEE